MYENPRFDIGQMVVCCLFDGVWLVTNVFKVSCGSDNFYRYEIRKGDVYEGDIVELWLNPIKFQVPVLKLIDSHAV